MNELDAVLTERVRGGNGKDRFAVTMEIAIRLPFPPAVGMAIGLYDHSTFNHDAYQPTDVIWNAARRQFEVASEGTRMGSANDAREVVLCLLARGWRVRLDCAAPNWQTVAYDDDENYAIVARSDCKPYYASKDELWCLEGSDEPFTILRQIGEPLPGVANA